MTDRPALYDQDYLGDGVYVGHDGYQIWLYLDDDSRPASTGIALEPMVLEALDRYRERVLSEEGTTVSEREEFDIRKDVVGPGLQTPEDTGSGERGVVEQQKIQRLVERLWAATGGIDNVSMAVCEAYDELRRELGLMAPESGTGEDDIDLVEDALAAVEKGYSRRFKRESAKKYLRSEVARLREEQKRVSKHRRGLIEHVHEVDEARLDAEARARELEGALREALRWIDHDTGGRGGCPEGSVMEFMGRARRLLQQEKE